MSEYEIQSLDKIPTIVVGYGLCSEYLASIKPNKYYFNFNLVLSGRMGCVAFHNEMRLSFSMTGFTKFQKSGKNVRRIIIW